MKTRTHFHIITLFPESFESYLESSIMGRARESGAVQVDFYNPRDFTDDKHRNVDDKPYGGGPGMVLQAEPIVKAVKKAVGRKKDVRILMTSADGETFSAETAASLAHTAKHIVIIAGHYEGIDARVTDMLDSVEKISVGPYILTGGELPALIVIDAVTRHIPGVLGNEQSLEETRASRSEVYTRPDTIHYKGKDFTVPDVLLSGNHKEIEAWRRGEAGNDNPQ